MLGGALAFPFLSWDSSVTKLEKRAGLFDATILRGDIGGASNADNSYHVVYADGVDNTTILDGFTVSDGNANGPRDLHFGGGLYSNAGDLHIDNCTFEENRAVGGGGLFSFDGNPMLTNCSFLDNVTFSGFGVPAGGGGLFKWEGILTLNDCAFTNNSSVYGGGLLNREGVFTLNDCTFTDNSAT